MIAKKLFLAAGVFLLASTLAQAGMVDHIQRKKIAGIDVLVYPTAVKDVVTIMAALPAGDSLAVAHHENAAVAKLTAMMLDRGTLQQDKFAIAKQLESVGATVYFSTQNQSLRVDGRCLSKDLPLVVRMIGEQLRQPAFTQSEIDKARQQFVGELRNRMDNVEYRAREALQRAMFPEGDPNYLPALDELVRDAGALTVADLKAFHHKYYGPDHMTLVLVGDVKMAAVEAAIASAFKGWTGGTPYLRDRKEASSRAPVTRDVAVEMPGKTSTVLMLGQATGLRYQDPDSLSLRVGTGVLGTGFTGRLLRTLRDVEGLTYGIGATAANDVFTAGNWQITGTFAPELLERGVQATEREVRHWWADGITAQELAARKSNLIGSYQVSLADTEGLAQNLLNGVLANKGAAWLDEYPKAIAAITLDEVNSAIRRHLDPQKMITVRAGTLSKP